MAMKTVDYPYVSGNTGSKGSCKYDASKGVVGVSSSDPYTYPTPESQQALKEALANVGPTSIAIEADKMVFQTYKSGILTSTKCGTSLDHEVLAVGYGSNYWIVKNSWGAGWGDEGYLKIGMDGGDGPGICGIQEEPCYPNL